MSETVVTALKAILVLVSVVLTVMAVSALLTGQVLPGILLLLLVGVVVLLAVHLA